MNYDGLLTWAVMLAFASIFTGIAAIARNVRDKKRAKQDQKEILSQSYGNSITGDIYRGLVRLDAALDRTTKPPVDFVGLCHCPSCGTFAWHYIDKYTKKHVVRRCVKDGCDKKWKQVR